MSVDTKSTPLTCPQCGRALAAEGLAANAVVLCAGCHTVFPRIDPGLRRTSGQAVASLVLGCASLLGLFVTGIPAVLLGVVALRNIRKQPDALKGTGLAIGGIAAGSVFGLVCGGCTVFSLVMGLVGRRSMVNTEDPQQVIQIGEKIGQCEMPTAVMPLKAIEFGMMDMRTVVYGNNPRAAFPLIVLAQHMQGTPPGQVELQTRQAVRGEHGRGGEFTAERTEILTFVIRGEPVTVQKTTGVDEWSGYHYREYSAEIPDPGHITMIMVATPDESGVTLEIGPRPPPPSPTMPPSAPRQTHSTTALSEEDVQRFFESFQ